MPREKQPAPPPIPPGTLVLLTKEQTSAAIGYSPRSFDAMLSAGEYPVPDLKLNRFPRWRIETHNSWAEDRVERHKNAPLR